MIDKEKNNSRKEEILRDLKAENEKNGASSAEDWPTQAQYDMLDFIEEQGIYIRQ